MEDCGEGGSRGGPSRLRVFEGVCFRSVPGTGSEERSEKESRVLDRGEAKACIT